MAYLDVMVTKSALGLSTTIFRKQTNTGLYLKWGSLSPIAYKRNLVNNLIHRAYKICNSYKLMHVEFNNIKDLLFRNGYPANFVDNQIKRYLDKQHGNQCREGQTINPCHHGIFLSLPFIGNSSIHLKKELMSFCRRHLPPTVQVTIISKPTTIRTFFPYKDKQVHLHRANVIYQLKCSCGKRYIGQTRRNLQFRMDEHNPATKKHTETDVTAHLYNNSNHYIDFTKPEILATASTYRELSIKKTLLVQKFQPELNEGQSSFPLFLFNL